MHKCWRWARLLVIINHFVRDTHCLLWHCQSWGDFVWWIKYDLKVLVWLHNVIHLCLVAAFTLKKRTFTKSILTCHVLPICHRNSLADSCPHFVLVCCRRFLPIQCVRAVQLTFCTPLSVLLSQFLSESRSSAPLFLISCLLREQKVLILARRCHTALCS